MYHNLFFVLLHHLTLCQKVIERNSVDTIWYEATNVENKPCLVFPLMIGNAVLCHKLLLFLRRQAVPFKVERQAHNTLIFLNILFCLNTS